MRSPACEKLEIIQLVEHSHLPVRRTLEKLGIPRATYYRWYDLYHTGGPDLVNAKFHGRYALGKLKRKGIGIMEICLARWMRQRA